MNIETAAQALAGNGWGSLREPVRDMHRADATAAIDAYRTLTADQWEVQRGLASVALCEATDHEWDDLEAEAQGDVQRVVDAVMASLGFRRAEEPTHTQTGEQAR